MKKDILLYMSDQHSYRLQRYAGDSLVRTPNLDRIAAAGTVMTQAYTSCPLCVPARASMISGLLPSNNGVLFNFTSLNSNQATFLHSLTVSGYETVLCGRMHFVGPDQRHGYARRIAGDRTPVFHNGLRGKAQKPTKVTGYDENSSVRYIGAGDSPVLAYDRYVVEHALDFLQQQHDRPLFLTVGTYGPHFPYVAPQELYDYYYSRVSLQDVTPHPAPPSALDGKMQETDPEVARAARAAYYAMVELQDRHIGAVYDAFQQYLQRTGHEGVFIYVSDHGDMNGTFGYYGKQVFYEPSAHIPFLLQGAGIPAGKKIDSPVSLMDVGPTVCSMAGAQILSGDGVDLMPVLNGERDDTERMVPSELYSYLADGTTSLGRMIRWRNWKYITYSGRTDDVLIDCSADSEEWHNCIAEHPQVAETLRAQANRYRSYEQIMVHEQWFEQQLKLLFVCDFDDTTERWVCPDDLPELETPVCSKQPFVPTTWVTQLRKKLST